MLDLHQPTDHCHCGRCLAGDLEIRTSHRDWAWFSVSPPVLGGLRFALSHRPLELRDHFESRKEPSNCGVACLLPNTEPNVILAKI